MGARAGLCCMSAILIVVLLVAAVWGGVVFLRGGLLGGCLLVLLAGTCFGHPFFNLPAGPVPLTVDRLLWLILLVLCWPLAVLALLLYPVVWLLMLPLRLLGITVDALFSFIKSVIFLPARVLRQRPPS